MRYDAENHQYGDYVLLSEPDATSADIEEVKNILLVETIQPFIAPEHLDKLQWVITPGFRFTDRETQEVRICTCVAWKIGPLNSNGPR